MTNDTLLALYDRFPISSQGVAYWLERSRYDSSLQDALIRKFQEEIQQLQSELALARSAHQDNPSAYLVPGQLDPQERDEPAENVPSRPLEAILKQVS